jgi:hypothetical protein
MDRPPRYIEQALPMPCQQGDQQNCPAGVQIRCPHHFCAIGQLQDRANELQQCVLVVLDPLRVQHPPGFVHDDAVVSALS